MTVKMTTDGRRPTAVRHLLVVGGLWSVVALMALAIALAPLEMLLPALGLALAVALALLDPVFGVYWAILSVPAQETVALPGGVSLTQASVVLAAGAWGLRTLAHPERCPAPGRLLPLWALLLWALLLSSSFTPYSTAEALRATARWAVAFLVWVIAVDSVRPGWRAIGLMACLLLAPAFEAALGLAQSWRGDGPPSFRIAADLPYVRAYGTIGQPNSFAGYMNMAWPLALTLSILDLRFWVLERVPQSTIHNPQSTLRLAGRLALTAGLWSITLLLLTALVASLSRGAWLGAAAGLVAMGLALGRWTTRRLATLGLALALAAAIWAGGLLPDAIEARLSSITRSLGFFDPAAVEVTPENFAVVERMAQLQAGWRMFVAHPLLGVGPGNYTAAYADVVVAPWYISKGHAHNFYLHVAAEAGAVGLAAYLAVIAGTAVLAARLVRRSRNPFWRAIAVGGCGVVGAVAGHNLFENLHVLNMGIQLAGIWALLEVGNRQQATGKRQRATDVK